MFPFVPSLWTMISISCYTPWCYFPIEGPLKCLIPCLGFLSTTPTTTFGNKLLNESTNSVKSCLHNLNFLYTFETWFTTSCFGNFQPHKASFISSKTCHLIHMHHYPNFTLPNAWEFFFWIWFQRSIFNGCYHFIFTFHFIIL